MRNKCLFNSMRDTRSKIKIQKVISFEKMSTRSKLSTKLRRQHKQTKIQVITSTQDNKTLSSQNATVKIFYFKDQEANDS